jgi:hypothetical protein
MAPRPDDDQYCLLLVGQRRQTVGWFAGKDSPFRLQGAGAGHRSLEDDLSRFMLNFTLGNGHRHTGEVAASRGFRVPDRRVDRVRDGRPAVVRKLSEHQVR